MKNHPNPSVRNHWRSHEGVERKPAGGAAQGRQAAAIERWMAHWCQGNLPCFRFALLLIALFVLTGIAYAGGWAIITLIDLPDYAETGKPLHLTFSVRQHGVTLLAGLEPAVRAATAAGLKATAAVQPTKRKGEYTAALVLPQPGEWTITIDSGFGQNSTTLPMLKVIPPGTTAPPPFADGTRGGRLFVAKGCVGCHRHQEINPERSSSPALDLSTKRFEHESLKKFLADPSIKTAEMPNLNLRHEEVTALAAFINKFSAKQKQQAQQK